MKKIFAFAILLVSLKTFAQDIDAATALNLIKSNAAALNIRVNSDAGLPVITNAYKDEQSGITFIYIQQQYKGIKVFNQLQSAIFKDGLLQYHSGNFINGIGRMAPNSLPAITAAMAVTNAANDLQLPAPGDMTVLNTSGTNKIVFSNAGISKRNIKAELLWLYNEPARKVDLVWSVKVFPLHTADSWNIMVDAATGSIIQKKNETIYEHHVEAEKADNGTMNPITNYQFSTLNSQFLIPNSQFPNNNHFSPPPTTSSATYNVIPYPVENLYKGNLALEANPWLKAGVGNNAITHGWHFDGTNNYNITRGNNVFAYDDSANVDHPGRWATSSTLLPTLNFNFTPNFNQQPYLTANRNLAITNLFYWNNIVHDITYQYGFTEVAGNFQYDNLGRGGLGYDLVLAEAQDGSGLNNANFNPQPDGDSSTMQMYLWTANNGFNVISPALGNMACKESSMSTSNKLANVGSKTGMLALYTDGINSNACNAATNNLTGKIALIQYSFQTGCTYALRVKNAQNAGAIAVVVIGSGNNPTTMGGNDNTITIPAIMIGINDGATLLNAMSSGDVVVKLENGVMYDGDLDNGIVVHEYGHGISNRLTAGAASSSCLNNNEQGGEGWSDYLALMFTTDWSTATINDGTLPRRMGVYAANQKTTGYGIRYFPYSTDMSVNPHTYADLVSNGEVHYIGEVWCAVLWDLTWDLIHAENAITANLYNAAGTGGNVIAMNLVMMGMKLQPCSPGFLDSRDAILAADDLLYNGKHKCLIWQTFARRGMGYSAVQGSSNSTSDQTVAFDIPMSVSMARPAVYKVVQSTAGISFNLKATCQCKTPTNNYKIKAVLPTGFVYAGSTGGGIAAGDSVVFKNINFNKVFQTDSVSLNLTITSTGCALDSVINDNRDNKTIGGFTNNTISGVNSWSATTAYSHSPVTAFQATDLITETNFALTSTAFNPAKLSMLSFWHRYELEGGYDGGVVEVSTNNGSTWQNISNLFVQNGCNTTISSNNTALANQNGFSGFSSTFNQSIANVSSLFGKTALLRFRVGTDVQNGGLGTLDGWIIDDIVVVNGCGSVVKFYVYDSANNLLDSTSVPVFVTPKPVPVKFVSFTAKANNKTSLLNWQVAEQVNIRSYSIEKSDDGINWRNIANQAANSLQKASYNYVDEQPFAGWNFYRIKASDFSGAVNFTQVEKVRFGNDGKSGLILLPNPAVTETNLLVPRGFNADKLIIADAQGRIILQQTVNSSTIKINTAGFTNGNYLVSVYNKAGERLIEKLSIAK